MIYDPNELQQALEQGERKFAERRQRARRQKKRAIFALCLVGLSLVAGAGLWWMSRGASAPAAPVLVVKWPRSKTAQVVASGQTVLAREGQPFGVSVSNAQNWNVSWGSSGVQNMGDSFEWAPQKNGEVLLAHCRAKGSGWSKSAAISPELSLRALTPVQMLASSDGTPSGDARDYTRFLPASAGKTAVWLFPFVQAGAGASWDERAVSALSDSAMVVLGAAQTNAPAPTPALWQIASDFEGGTQTPATGATYASLQAADLEQVMPQVGAQIVRLAPEASIKWIARLDKTPPQGIVRLSFDGKHQRQAWIKRAGQTAGTPVTGWENGQWKGVAAPVVPTPTPTSHQ